MTDKQIIIDGVDVSKCGHYHYGKCEIDYDEWNNEIIRYNECQNNPNCYYKQLKREKQECQQAMDNYVQLDLQRVKEYNELVDLYKAKEQECEELKKERDTLSATRNKLLDDLWVVEENLKDYTEHFNKASDELDQLKAENDKLKSELHSKVEFIQEQRNIIDEYSKEIRMYKKCQGNRASKREEKLKHALAEIKEIAEDFYLDGEHVKDKYLAQEILQKISEVI